MTITILIFFIFKNIKICKRLKQKKIESMDFASCTPSGYCWPADSLALSFNWLNIRHVAVSSWLNIRHAKVPSLFQLNRINKSM